jgi:single-strand DNA-binding protein
MNSVHLIGRLTKEPELVFTPSGVAVFNNSIAIDEKYKDEKKTFFFNVKAFSKLAEMIATYSYKGQLVGITGRLTQRSYDNKEGQKVYLTEITIENIRFLSYKDDATQPNNNAMPPLSDSDLPF